MFYSGWGRIINISSVQGTISAPGKAPYAASKHGIIGLTKVRYICIIDILLNSSNIDIE